MQLHLSRPRLPMRLLGLALIAASLLVTVSGQPTSETKAAPACGVRVYMTASGATGADATNDTDVETSLENGTDLCVTRGVEYYLLSTVSGSVTKANYDVIYLQGQNNYGLTELNEFHADDYAVIDTFVSAGGGLVIGEWIAWNACDRGFAGAWGSLNAIMPTTIRSGCAYGSGEKVRFYRWDRPTSASLDTGVTGDFIFQPADFAGSLSYLTLKTGATGYYWARWNSNVANIPAAANPSTNATDLGVGMAGWVPAGKSGRVFSFSTTNGAPELADTTAANSFRRLLINSLGWTGSVGGSITPDAVSINGTAGVSLSTPALTPSNISGTVTYAVSGGSLPTGLVLNTSTGAIAGTPASGGSVNVTILASGSGGGSGSATIAFQIAGPATTSTAATTTTAAPTTTTLGSGNNSASSATTTTTSIASGGATPAAATTTTAVPALAAAGGGPSEVAADSLPETGANGTFTLLASLLFLAGIALLAGSRRIAPTTR